MRNGFIKKKEDMIDRSRRENERHTTDRGLSLKLYIERKVIGSLWLLWLLYWICIPKNLKVIEESKDCIGVYNWRVDKFKFLCVLNNQSRTGPYPKMHELMW